MKILVLVALFNYPLSSKDLNTVSACFKWQLIEHPGDSLDILLLNMSNQTCLNVWLQAAGLAWALSSSDIVSNLDQHPHGCAVAPSVAKSLAPWGAKILRLEVVKSRGAILAQENQGSVQHPFCRPLLPDESDGLSTGESPWRTRIPKPRIFERCSGADGRDGTNSLGLGSWFPAGNQT